MNHLFYLGLGATIFSAMALVAFLYLTHTSRAMLQRIREVTHRGRDEKGENLPSRNLGRKFFAAVH
jgi:hypothetical protein